MHITVWMAGNAFKIDRISRLEEDWNGRYVCCCCCSACYPAYTILKIVRSDTSEYARICTVIAESELRSPQPSCTHCFSS